MKELRVAQSAGFCFGVNRSVGMAEKLLEDNRGDVYVEYWSGCAYRENERWELA